MAYSLTFAKGVLKDLVEIDEPFYSKIKAAIQALSENPRPFGYRKLKGRDGYRVRVGNYRVIYDITDALLIVMVIEVGNRKDVYDD